MTTKTASIEKELFKMIEQELSRPNYVVEPFVQKNKEEVGEIILKLAQDEKLVENLILLSIIYRQVLPYLEDEHYIPILATILKYDNLDARIRFQTIQRLGWRQTQAQEAIPLIVKYLGEGNGVGDMAAIALGEMEYEKFEEIIPGLLSALKNAPYYVTRMNAARILIKNRDHLQAFLPQLIESLESDEDFRFRQKLARNFGEINIPIVKKALLKAHKNDKHPVVRTVAKTSLDDLEKLK
ncbi:MAG: HEAT repeat domain-containing protein [Candidatus Heimdallarchaeota archaeon]